MLMFFQTRILIIIIFVEFNTANINKLQPRILHGSQARIEEFPYFASLKSCGAAIISNKWLLTAAHCVSNARSLSGFVWVGGESFQKSERIPYDEAIVHEEFHMVAGIPVHDIALIRLSRPIKFSNKVKQVALPKLAVSQNVNAVFTGRGKDETGRSSRSLMKIELVRLTTEQCISQIPPESQTFANRYRNFFEKAITCARHRENRPSICHGDSGSPLVSGRTVIGIASFIGKSCKNARIAFFVNVTNYVAWIKSKTGL